MLANFVTFPFFFNFEEGKKLYQVLVCVDGIDFVSMLKQFVCVGGREAYRFRRRSISDVYEKANGTGPKSAPPPPYGM